MGEFDAVAWLRKYAELLHNFPEYATNILRCSDQLKASLKASAEKDLEIVRPREAIGRWDKAEGKGELQDAESELIKCLSQPLSTTALSEYVEAQKKPLVEEIKRLMEVVEEVITGYESLDFDLQSTARMAKDALRKELKS